MGFAPGGGSVWFKNNCPTAGPNLFNPRQPWLLVEQCQENGYGHATWINLLQGHGLAIGNIAFGGTRGYLCPNDTSFGEENDTSIYTRELLRTEAALQEMEQALHQNENAESSEQEAIRILLLHYPPFNDKNEPSGFTELLTKYKVDHCIFGHLHDKNSFDRIPKTFDNTQLHLVSADYMDFKLKQIL